MTNFIEKHLNLIRVLALIPGALVVDCILSPFGVEVRTIVLIQVPLLAIQLASMVMLFMHIRNDR